MEIIRKALDFSPFLGWESIRFFSSSSFLLPSPPTHHNFTCFYGRTKTKVGGGRNTFAFSFLAGSWDFVVGLDGT